MDDLEKHSANNKLLFVILNIHFNQDYYGQITV